MACEKTAAFGLPDVPDVNITELIEAEVYWSPFCLRKRAFREKSHAYASKFVGSATLCMRTVLLPNYIFLVSKKFKIGATLSSNPESVSGVFSAS